MTTSLASALKSINGEISFIKCPIGQDGFQEVGGAR